MSTVPDTVDPTPLTPADCSALGLDARGVIDLLDAQQAAGLDLHSLVVLRHGRLACRGWAAPYDEHSVQLLYSLSKTVVSACVGIAVDEGLFGYDDLLVDHFADLADARDGVAPSAAARTIRVRDALAMATGHTRDMYPDDNHLTRDRIRDLFVPGPEATPGETFAYNQMATYALARIIEQRSGVDLLQFANDRLLHPLGITEAWWAPDRDGLAQGFSGLHLRTESVATFFQLLLDDGIRDGLRLLPREWIERHRLVQVSTGDPADGGDWSQGYGWQCWIATHGYRGDGACGQYALVLPEHDMVVAMTGQHTDMQALLRLVWRHLLPAIDADTSPDASADAELAERLDAWWLPPVAGDSLLGTRVDADDAWGGRLSISDDLLTWTDDAGVRQSAVLGDDEWARTRWHWPHGHLDVALSAGRRDDAVLVRVVLTNSPHSFTWTIRPGRPTEFAWQVEPLHEVDPRALAMGASPAGAR